MARKRRRKRVMTENLVLRPFAERDEAAFIAGLEGAAEPIDRFDQLVLMDAAARRGGMGRRRQFRFLLKAQEGATMYGNPGLRFQIFTRRKSRWLGYVAIYEAKWNVHSAAMDYYLLNQYWGQGIAAEAVRGMLPYCWSDLGLHRIEAIIEEDNVRSLRFAERLGLSYEGTRRHGAHIDRKWRDMRVYSVLATDALGLSEQ